MNRYQPPSNNITANLSSITCPLSPITYPPSPIPIAALNHYAYCPHRCGRMFCMGDFIDNHYTIEGTSLHDRVHTVGSVNRDDTWQVRAIWLKSEKYGRPSLALDLMEEFRPLIVDAMVLNALNKEKLTPDDFTSEAISNAVSLTKEGLKIFFRLYEQKKQSKFKHPVLKRQCTYQQAFEIQARFVAKYLM